MAESSRFVDVVFCAPAWLTTQRTLPVDGVLQAEHVADTAVSGAAAGAPIAVVRDQLQVTPEGLWRVVPAL